MRRIRGAATRWPRCPSPRPAHHHTKRSSLSLRFSSEKRELGGHQLSLHCRSLPGGSHSGLTSWRTQGNLQGSTTGNVTVIEQGEGLSTTSTWISANKVPTCRAQAVVPTCGFAHLQNQGGRTAWPGDSAGCQSASFRSSNDEFYRPYSLVGPCAGRELNHSPPALWRVSSGPIWPEGLGTTPGSCMTQWHLSPEKDRQNQSFAE